MRQHRQRLREMGISQSMPGKGNCCGDCIIEPFFGALKNEMLCGREPELGTFERFKAAIAGRIDFYSERRIKSKTKWMPPSKLREASIAAR